MLLRDDALQEVWFERPARPDGLGDLHVGRVSARVPALSGVFVTLADDASGFLPDAQGGEGLSEGDAVAVTVARPSQGGKGPRLTGKVPAEAPRAGPPRLVARGPGAALRLARAHPRAALRTDDAATARHLRDAVGSDRVALSPGPVLDDALEVELDALGAPEVPLAGGGRLLIHPTPALVAIDVDAGRAAGRDRDAHRRLNAAALAEAARQIRLRQLAGPILLDLAGMAPASRAALLPALRAAADPLTRVIGVTGLGLIEMVRTRIGQPLHEVLGMPSSPLTHGLAALRGAARQERAGYGRRRTLRAHPTVLAALRSLPGALDEYAAAATHPLLLRDDPSLSPGQEAVDECP